MKKQSGIKSAIRKTLRNTSKNIVSAEHRLVASTKKMFKSSAKPAKEAPKHMHKGHAPPPKIRGFMFSEKEVAESAEVAEFKPNYIAHAAPPFLKAVPKAALLKSQKLRPAKPRKTLSQRTRPFLNRMKKGFNKFVFVEKKAVRSVEETAGKDWRKLGAAEHRFAAKASSAEHKAVSSVKRGFSDLGSAVKKAFSRPKHVKHPLKVFKVKPVAPKHELSPEKASKRIGILTRLLTAERHAVSSIRKAEHPGKTKVRFVSAKRGPSTGDVIRKDIHKLSVIEHKMMRSAGTAIKNDWHKLSDAEHRFAHGVSSAGHNVASKAGKIESSIAKNIRDDAHKIGSAEHKAVASVKKGFSGSMHKLEDFESSFMKNMKERHARKVEEHKAYEARKAKEEKLSLAEKAKIADQKEREKQLHIAEQAKVAAQKQREKELQLAKQARMTKQNEISHRREIAAKERAIEEKQKAHDKMIAEKQALEQKRFAENKALHDKEIAEKLKNAEAKKWMHERGISDMKAMHDKKIADKLRAAEEKRKVHEHLIADKKALKEKKMAEKKALKEKKIADRLKAAEERRDAHEKMIADNLKAAQEKKFAKYHKIAENLKAKPVHEIKGPVTNERISHELESVGHDLAVISGRPEKRAKVAVQEAAEAPAKVTANAKVAVPQVSARGRMVFDVDEISSEIEKELKKGTIGKGEAEILKQRMPITQAMSGKVPPVCKKALTQQGKVCKGFIMTGVPGLDALFEKGIPQGSTVIIAGGAGSGKTILCLQTMFYHALGGDKCLYMSFEESEARLIEHMESFGWDAQSMIDKGRLMIKRFNPFDITRNVDALLMKAKGELLIDVEPVILPENFKPDFIVVDSLTAIASAFTGKEDSYRIYIEQLFRFFEKIHSTSFLITETKQIPTIFSQTGVEEFLADGVIVLYNIKRGNIRENAVEVLKLRGAKHEKKIVAMQISDKGMTVYPDQEVFGSIEETQ